MKNIVTIVLVLAGFTIASSAQSRRPQIQEDETAIRANVQQMERGWNMRSGAEFAKPFAEDSDYVVINGMHIKGRAANVAAHQQIFDSIYRNSNLKLVVESIRFLRDDIAIVHTLSTLLVNRTDPATGHTARVTTIMTKTGGKWEIAAFQNTAIQEFTKGGENK